MLLIVGCAQRLPPPRISFHTTAAASMPMRVAVMPFACADGVGKASAGVAEPFAAALRSLGLHEVVAVPPDLAAKIMPPAALARSAIRAEDLLAVRDRLRADAVMIGRIEQADTFDPVALGLTVHLVSCTDGEVLWSATAHFDASRSDVQADVEDWHQHHGGRATDSIAGWRLALRSPDRFARYTSDRLVATIPLPPDPATTAATASANPGDGGGNF